MASKRWTTEPAARGVTWRRIAAVLLGAAALPLALLAALLPAGLEAQDGVPFPDENEALSDVDRDGLAELYEFALGTDPENPDTDRDGYSDGLEVAHRSDPLIPTATLPDESAIRLDFLPEAGGVRICVTLHSPGGFDRDTTLALIMGVGENVRNCTRDMLRLGRVLRADAENGVVGYISRRLPLKDMRPRFSLGALLKNGPDYVLDDVLLGVRQGQFFRTEMTALPNGTWLGSTLFLTVTVETEGEPGFSPNEDCKQVFGRINGPVKVILDEFCEDAMDRYCPQNCGGDIGLRVVCIRDLFPR